MNRTLRVAFIGMIVSFGLEGCGSPPQIGVDKETFQAVDALFTAVSLRDPKLVDQCMTQLQGLKDEGKIPDSAFQSLKTVNETTKQGKWEPAQESLRSFMEGQRR